MDLRTVDFKDLYFPRSEWKWLRPSTHYPTSLNEAPDAFVWAAQVRSSAPGSETVTAGAGGGLGAKLWAWHPKGCALSTGFPGMQLRVLVLETDGSEATAHALYLKTVFTAQPAQDVEWVCALDVLTHRLGIGITKSGLPRYWKEALEACSLEGHLGVLAGRARYAYLSDEERQLLFDKRWDLSTLEIVETLSADIRQLFVAAIRKWNLTANQTKEAANMVVMLIKKYGEAAAKKALTGPFKGPEEFRSALMSMAQPELASLSNKRIEMLRGLHIPPRCSVYGDPSFERDVLKITHSPRNMSDFEAFKDWIDDPDVAAKIKALLEIYQ